MSTYNELIKDHVILRHQADKTLIKDAGNYFTGTEVETALAEIMKPNVEAFERTGFPNRTDSTLDSTDLDTNRNFTISPAVSSFNFYQNNKEYTSTGDTITIDDTEGLHYIYYDDGTLTETVNPTFGQEFVIVSTKVLVTIIYWDATNKLGVYVGEERHGITMDGDTHARSHFKDGLIWYTGLALNTIDADQDGSSNAHAQFGVDTGSVSDEDLGLSPDAITSTTGLPIYYRSGATGVWRKMTNAGFSVDTEDGTTSTRLGWNEFTGGSWGISEIASNNDFVLCHVFATTEKDYPIIAIMGQAEYTTAKLARIGATTEMGNLLLGNLPGPERTPLATVIFKTNTGYTNDVNALIVTTDEGDDYVNWRESEITRTAAGGDHGSLGGLADDDHIQYILADATRPMTSNWDIGNYTLTANGVTIDGTFTDGTASIVGGVGSGFSSITSTGFTGILSATSSLADGVTATTQSDDDNSTKVATTAYVDSMITTEDFWDRAGDDITPRTAGDDIVMNTTGTLGVTGNRWDEIWGTTITGSTLTDGTLSIASGALTGVTTIVTSSTIKNQADDSGIYTGAGDDLRLYHDGTDSFITNSTGHLDLTGGSGQVRIAHDGDSALTIIDNGVDGEYTILTQLDGADGSFTINRQGTGGTDIEIVADGDIIIGGEGTTITMDQAVSMVDDLTFTDNAGNTAFVKSDKTDFKITLMGGPAVTTSSYIDLYGTAWDGGGGSVAGCINLVANTVGDGEINFLTYDGSTSWSTIATFDSDGLEMNGNRVKNALVPVARIACQTDSASLTAGAWRQIVVLDTKDIETDSDILQADNTNDKIIVKESGYYRIQLHVTLGHTGTTRSSARIAIGVGGSVVSKGSAVVYDRGYSVWASGCSSCTLYIDADSADVDITGHVWPLVTATTVKQIGTAFFTYLEVTKVDG